MSNINDLPDEVMVEIFGYLSPNMLKSGNLVCKRWDDIISSSKELMSKFKLNLADSEDYLEAKDLNRNHQNIIVQHLSAESLDAISYYNLNELNLCLVEVHKLLDLVKAFRSLPMLKVFKAWEEKFEDDIPDIPNFQRIHLNIEKIECVAEILHIFDCSTLKNIRLLWNHEMSLERKLMAYELLSKQKNLEIFYLCEYRVDNFFHSPEIFLNFQFRLKTFRYFSAASPLKYYKNVIKFLESQKKSLTLLYLGLQPHKIHIIETVQKYVLDHMSNLKDLQLDLSIRSDDDDEYNLEMEEKLEPTEVTKNIKRLVYKGPQNSWHKCKRIIDLFPNIKYLYFVADYAREFRVLKNICQTLVNLESIEFVSFNSDLNNSYSVYFPNLKELTTFEIGNEDAFSSFISRHSETLEMIHIDDTSDMTELTAEAIMECENLKYLKLGSRLGDIYSVLYLFYEFTYRTKPLTFIYECYFTPTTFKLPEDKIFWDEKLGIEPEDEDLEPASESGHVRRFFKAIWNGINSMFS